MTNGTAARGAASRCARRARPGHRLGPRAHVPGSSSRADIARSTGLTRVTVSDLVAELIGEGLVAELGVRTESRVGKPATLRRMQTEAFQIVTVEADDHRMHGRHDARRNVVRATRARDGRAHRRGCRGTGRGAVPRPARRRGRCWASASPRRLIDPEGLVGCSTNRGCVLGARLQRARRARPRRQRRQRAHPRRVSVRLRGAATIVVTIGEGVGAGIVLDGRLVGGRHHRGRAGARHRGRRHHAGETPAVCACGRAAAWTPCSACPPCGGAPPASTPKLPTPHSRRSAGSCRSPWRRWSARSTSPRSCLRSAGAGQRSAGVGAHDDPGSDHARHRGRPRSSRGRIAQERVPGAVLVLSGQLGVS